MNADEFQDCGWVVRNRVFARILWAKRWEKTRFLRFDIQYIYFGSGSPKLIICCFGVAGTTAGTTVIPPRRS